MILHVCKSSIWAGEPMKVPIKRILFISEMKWKERKNRCTSRYKQMNLRGKMRVLCVESTAETDSVTRKEKCFPPVYQNPSSSDMPAVYFTVSIIALWSWLSFFRSKNNKFVTFNFFFLVKKYLMRFSPF